MNKLDVVQELAIPSIIGSLREHILLLRESLKELRDRIEPILHSEKEEKSPPSSSPSHDVALVRDLEDLTAQVRELNSFVRNTVSRCEI